MLNDFVAFIAKHLVEKPEEVEVTVEDKDEYLHYKLSVSTGDLGRVIGKEGRNARAMRVLLTAVSARQGRKAILEIQEDR